MILGNSLHVMTSLAEKEGLKGKVQMIYIDPPYGIKFGSNWQVSTRKRDVKVGKLEDASRLPEQIRAFRDTWRFGVHSYLSYIRERLIVGRDLLTPSGSVFIQIGDENVHLVRCIADEVLGSDNFVSLVTFRKTGGATSEFLAPVGDYILWYAQSREHLKYRELYIEKQVGTDTAEAYSRLEQVDGKRRSVTQDERRDPSLIPPKSKVFRFYLCNFSAPCAHLVEFSSTFG